MIKLLVICAMIAGSMQDLVNTTGSLNSVTFSNVRRPEGEISTNAFYSIDVRTTDVDISTNTDSTLTSIETVGDIMPTSPSPLKQRKTKNKMSKNKSGLKSRKERRRLIREPCAGGTPAEFGPGDQRRKRNRPRRPSRTTHSFAADVKELILKINRVYESGKKLRHAYKNKCFCNKLRRRPAGLKNFSHLNQTIERRIPVNSTAISNRNVIRLLAKVHTRLTQATILLFNFNDTETSRNRGIRSYGTFNDDLSSLIWHPEFGLQNIRCSFQLLLQGWKSYRPVFKRVKVALDRKAVSRRRKFRPRGNCSNRKCRCKRNCSRMRRIVNKLEYSKRVGELLMTRLKL